MNAIKFNGANFVHGENQSKVLPIPTYYDANDPAGTVVSCYKLNLLERIQVACTGRIYFSVLTFNVTKLQPQRPTAHNPVKEVKAEANRARIELQKQNEFAKTTGGKIVNMPEYNS